MVISGLIWLVLSEIALSHSADQIDNTMRGMATFENEKGSSITRRTFNTITKGKGRDTVLMVLKREKP